MMYYIRTKNGTRWKVREAVSLVAACNTIAHAMVRGSIGGKETIITHDGPERVLADVVQVNSDGTERNAS